MPHSLTKPAIESVLLSAFGSLEEEGPPLAVVATSDADRPELVLFTTQEVSRDQANQQLKTAGLSPLHNIRRAVPVESIPVLGTGKTDYRSLQASLGTGSGGPPGPGGPSR